MCGRSTQALGITMTSKHIWAFVFATLSACATTPAKVVKPTIPKTEAECIALGAHWTRLGLPPGDWMCDVKSTDSGRSCTDSAQCQGICIPPASAAAGQNAVGQCSEYLLNFGNVRRIKDGKVEKLNVD